MAYMRKLSLLARMPRLAAVALVAASCLSPGLPLEAQTAPAAPLRKGTLVVLSSSSILSAVNRADAIAAARVWMGVIGRRSGYDLDVRIQVSESPEDIKSRILDGSSNLVVLDAIEYLSMADLGLLEPVATGVRGKTAGSTYCLVVHRDSRVASLDDLAGKRISLFAPSNSRLGKIWLDVLLNERGLGRADRFFAATTEVVKPSSACLPVFFGKLDGCVIDESSLTLLTEMNPQIGAKLRVVRKSPLLTEGIVSVNLRAKSPYRQEVVNGLLMADHNAEGKQILTILKADRFAAFHDQLLDGVRELWTRYQRFAGQGVPAVRPAGTSGAPAVPSAATGVTGREMNR